MEDEVKKETEVSSKLTGKIKGKIKGFTKTPVARVLTTCGKAFVTGASMALGGLVVGKFLEPRERHFEVRVSSEEKPTEPEVVAEQAATPIE